MRGDGIPRSCGPTGDKRVSCAAAALRCCVFCLAASSLASKSSSAASSGGSSFCARAATVAFCFSVSCDTGLLRAVLLIPLNTRSRTFSGSIVSSGRSIVSALSASGTPSSSGCKAVALARSSSEKAANLSAISASVGSGTGGSNPGKVSCVGDTLAVRLSVTSSVVGAVSARASFCSSVNPNRSP